jgi:ribose-phosphate pyrophosphokinase
MIYLNDVELQFAQFPNGETKMNEDQIKGNLRHLENSIDLKFESDGDLIKLMFLKNYLDTLSLSSNLTISYMPYSRMDRVENGSAFTLKYITNFINSLLFDSVIVVEPHSDVTPALLDDVTTVFPTSDLLSMALDLYEFDQSRDYLFFPDGGAAKRYGKVKGFKHLIGNKSRDFETGHITGLDIIGKVDTEDFKVIILDDLCSRGGTFILSAEKLKEIGAKEIYLVVTHCEETINQGDILHSNLIDEVLTTDSIIKKSENKKIHIIDWRTFK